MVSVLINLIGLLDNMVIKYGKATQSFVIELMGLYMICNPHSYNKYLSVQPFDKPMCVYGKLHCGCMGAIITIL